MSDSKGFYMKKKLKPFFCIICGFLLFISGCRDQKKDLSSTSVSATDTPTELTEATEATVAVTEPTEATVPPRDRTLIDVDTQHIIDNIGCLTNESFEELNTYAAWISHNFSIQLAVVLTDSLEGQSPQEYAEQDFEALYGTGDGFLFLVNDDTKQDILYASGRCAAYWSKEKDAALFAAISPMLAVSDYAGTVQYVLERIELALPEHITDFSDILDLSSVQRLEKLCDTIAEQHALCLNICIENGASQEHAENLYETLYGSKSGALLMIDPETDGLYAVLGGTLRDSVSNTALGALLDRTDAKLPDYEDAASTFAEGIASLS